MTTQQFRDVLDAPEQTTAISSKTILIWWDHWIWPLNKVLLFYASGIALSFFIIRIFYLFL